MKQDYQSEVDTWLQSISEEAIQKVRHVVLGLDLEWQLRDHNIFALPLHKLLKDELVSKEDLVSILTNLQNKKILLVSRYLGEYPEPMDEDGPRGRMISTIEFSPDIINSSDTQIRLNIAEFRYLLHQLKLKLSKNTADGLDSDAITWDESKYRWLSEIKFAFGDKIAEFGSKKSDRIKIFRMLTEAEGGYVRVDDMRTKTGKSGQQVCGAISDINNEILKDTGFKIVSKGKGAYRFEHKPL